MRNLLQFILPVLALAAIPPVQAQAFPDSGARVRVTSPQSLRGRTVGVLERFTTDTVVVAGEPISRASISRFEVSAGRKSRWLQGLGIGFVGGAIAGVAVAVIATASSSYDPTCRIDEVNICPAAAGLGAGAGALVGAVIGSQVRRDGWRVVPLSTIWIGPTLRSGGALGVSIGLQF